MSAKKESGRKKTVELSEPAKDKKGSAGKKTVSLSAPEKMNRKASNVLLVERHSELRKSLSKIRRMSMKIMDARTKSLAREAEEEEMERLREEALARKRSMWAKYGNLIEDQFSDHWEEGLIPQELIDEIYAEFGSGDELSSSEESYEEITESGTVIRKRRKKAKKQAKKIIVDNLPRELRRQYVEDVGGGIPKATLLKMTVPKLKTAVKEMSAHVERVKAENMVLQRTIDSMEEREREIEANIPKFTYRYPWERDLRRRSLAASEAAIAICASESSKELDDDTEQEADKVFHPSTDLNMNDTVFAGMSAESKGAMEAFLRSAGDVVPENFDVMKYKYGELIKAATEGDGGPTPEYLHDHAHRHHLHHHHHIEKEQSAFKLKPAEEENTPSKSEEKASSSSDSDAPGNEIDFSDKGSDEEDKETIDNEDSEFPDFNPMEAYVLPTVWKNRFIEEEIPLMVEEFSEKRLLQLQKDNTHVLVYIDTYQTSYIMMKKLISELLKLAKKSRHPMTGLLKAETLILFLKRVKNYLMSEETKHNITLAEFRKHKNRIDTQLNQNRQLGESLQLIDFEQLRIENKQLVQDIEEEHDSLQHLKLITTRCMEDLKQSRVKLYRQLAMSKQLEGSVQVRVLLKKNFEREANKYGEELVASAERSNFFKKRLRAFRAPCTLDYIREKAEEDRLRSNLRNMQRKITDAKIIKADIKKGFKTYEQNFPMTLDMKRTNQKWLEEIKHEVEERSLLKLLKDDDYNPKGVAKPPHQYGYTGERRSKKKLDLSTSTRSTMRKKSYEEVDDLELVKAKLPIPTPGTLIMLAKQQEEEDAENARISRIKSEGFLSVDKMSQSFIKRKSVVKIEEPPVNYRPTRRLTIPAVKTRHASAIRNEKQAVMRREQQNFEKL